MLIKFSIIIPVYNRPKEIDELLESLIKQQFSDSFEVIIIEDGSKVTCKTIVKKYKPQLNIQYFFKENNGAGISRNYGMQHANGNYFIILDSDVILPKQYLFEVKKILQQNYTDAFGGPDAAHQNFTPLQKAINYSMTSLLTTGGIRGKKKGLGKFQPRSFNMGISKEAFLKTKGFNRFKVGEDIDLTFRLWKNGYTTQLIEEAFVYHKRRNTLNQFFNQTLVFGKARPQLNKRYPSTAKITYWFPSMFIVGLYISIILLLFGYWQFLAFYGVYILMIFLDSLLENKSVQVAFLSIITSLTQFLGYGWGFLQSTFFKNKEHET